MDAFEIERQKELDICGNECSCVVARFDKD